MPISPSTNQTSVSNQLKQPLWAPEFERYGVPAHIETAKGVSSVMDLLQPKLTQYAERTAFSMGAANLTFAQLDNASRRFAAFLQAQGTEKGDRVAIQLPNVLQYPVVILGCLRAGVVLVNVNPLYTHYELAYQLSDAKATGLVILDGMSGAYDQLPEEDKDKLSWVVRCSMTEVAGVGSDLALLMRPVAATEQAEPSASTSSQDPLKNQVKQQLEDTGYIHLAQVLTSFQAADFKPVSIDPDDLALLQYTGGTTGKPKGAMLTQGNVLSNVLQCYAMFGQQIEAQLAQLETKEQSDAENKQVVILNPLPLYHVFSFTVCGLLGIYGGWQDMFVTNPRDMDGLVDTIEARRPHVIPSVNTLFAGMLHHPKFATLDFSQLVLSIGGGTAIIKDIAQRWKAVTGVTINEGYGMSETSPVIAFNPLGTTDFNGSVGLPLPDTDIKVIDDAGNACDIGETGEVCIKGLQVMKGYWQRDNTDVFTEDGFFRSGDIGVMNEAGYVTLVDRKKDMILVSGFNVYPNEIEAALTEHPKVFEVAVVGMADAHSGEVPKAFVVKADDSLTSEELDTFARERLTGYKRPHAYEFIAELPKSAVGKILRKQLRDD